MHEVKGLNFAAAGSAEVFSALPRIEGAKHLPAFTNNQPHSLIKAFAFITCRPPVSYADPPQRSLRS